MKKTYPVSEKARSATGWHKHLRKDGKRVANKSRRKLLKAGLPDPAAGAFNPETTAV